MATFISHSPERPRHWRGVGRAAARGWVLGLSGNLGAGKTQLVKGLARGLDIAARVHSPTFTLLNQYEGGRLPLFHLDSTGCRHPNKSSAPDLSRICSNLTVWPSWSGPKGGGRT